MVCLRKPVVTQGLFYTSYYCYSDTIIIISSTHIYAVCVQVISNKQLDLVQIYIDFLIIVTVNQM